MNALRGDTGEEFADFLVCRLRKVLVPKADRLKRSRLLSAHDFVRFASKGVAGLAGAVFMTNLLKGVVLGVIVGIAFVLRENVRGALAVDRQPGHVSIQFLRDGTFLTKPALLAALIRVPANTRVTVDGNGHFIDFDIKETLLKFETQSRERGKNIRVDLTGIDVLEAVGAPAHG